MKGPVLLEELEILLELVEDVVIREIVLFELLDDDHDKQVEHDQLADDVEGDKEEVSVGSSAVLGPVNAKGGLYAVEHGEVPVLPG